MRKIFGELICEFCKKSPDVILITGDIGYGIFDEVRKAFPDRYLNLGICEQSIIGVAAGMALQGAIPFVYTITPFLIERPFEQIKLDIDQQNIPVKLIGYSDYPTLGPTHTELDGPKLMSLFNNITAYFPDTEQKCVDDLWAAFECCGPAFVSLKSSV